MTQEMVITFPGNKRVKADYKGFSIETDQPVYQDGDGSSPAPFDLFMASIGTCAAHYLLSFCRNRGLARDGMYVTQRLEFNPETKKIAKVIIEAHLPADFPEKYRKAAIRAMESCAVKKYIEAPFAFETVTVKKN